MKLKAYDDMWFDRTEIFLPARHNLASKPKTFSRFGKGMEDNYRERNTI